MFDTRLRGVTSTPAIRDAADGVPIDQSDEEFSMNTIYKLVWNAATQSFVAASELAKGRKKSSGRKKALALATAMLLGGTAFNTALARSSVEPVGSACTTSGGQAGSVDASGACTVGGTARTSADAIGIMSGGFVGSGNGITIAYGTETANATANGDIAIGGATSANSGANGNNTFATAVGDSANAAGTNTTAIGQRSVANAAGATAMGSLSHATNAGAVAMGNSAVSSGVASSAIGQFANASGNGSIAIGGSQGSTTAASASATHAIAIGENAKATHLNATAIGVDSATDRNESVSIGNGTTKRQLTNMAAGTQSTDAVNVSQLSPVVNALGGGASINATTGVVTGPSYNLTNGGTQTTVGGALGALDGALSTANTNIGNNTTNITNLQQQVGAISNSGVQYDDPASKGQVTLGGTGASSTVKLTNVANGAISSSSTDAVNGSQLHGLSDTLVTALGGGATVNPDGSIVLPSYQVGGTTVHSVSDAVQNLDGRVTQNSSDISDLADQIGSGTVGLVQQASAGAKLTVGANTDGAAVDFTGTNGTRMLTGVAAGTVNSTSTDAVNGSQLFGTASSVADALGGGAAVKADGSVSTPSYSVGGSTVNNVGAAITNLDGRVTQNTGDIADLSDQISSGTVGLVQQAAPGANLTVGANTDGGVVDFTGSSGARVLSGVANGTGNTDAVSLGQLKSALGYDPDDSLAPLLALRYDDATLASASLGGTNGTVLNNVAPGQIAAGSMQAVNGGQLFAMQQNFQGQIDWLTGQVGDLNDRVTLVEQGATNPPPAPDPGNGGTPGYGPSPGTGDNSLVVGNGADASGANSSAIGNGAVASGDNSTATGNGAVASGNNSVALGAGSVADRDNTVSVGSEGHERQITNVAAGTQRTDAANWGQVQDAVNGVKDWANQKFHQVDKRINRMGAMSAAYGQMAFSAQGLETKNRLGVGVGTQGGQSAIAMGYSRQLKPNMNLSFGGSASAGDVSMGAGLSVGW
jgi:autotransporter adhesin